MSYPNLSQDDINTITAFFSYVDEDHDGQVTVSEVNDAMAVDLNADGVVTPDEKVASGQQWMNTYFSAEDLNGDQKLTLTELLQYNNDHKSQTTP